MPIKTVIDTNVWISALLNPGTARQIVRHLETDQFQLVCSTELMDEMLRVLHRPKIIAITSQEDADEMLSLVQDKALFIELQHIPPVSRAPKDDMFLACAVAGNCVASRSLAAYYLCQRQGEVLAARPMRVVPLDLSMFPIGNSRVPNLPEIPLSRHFLV